MRAPDRHTAPGHAEQLVYDRALKEARAQGKLAVLFKMEAAAMVIEFEPTAAAWVDERRGRKREGNQKGVTIAGEYRLREVTEHGQPPLARGVRVQNPIPSATVTSRGCRRPTARQTCVAPAR